VFATVDRPVRVGSAAPQRAHLDGAAVFPPPLLGSDVDRLLAIVTIRVHRTRVASGVRHLPARETFLAASWRGSRPHTGTCLRTGSSDQLTARLCRPCRRIEAVETVVRCSGIAAGPGAALGPAPHAAISGLARRALIASGSCLPRRYHELIRPRASTPKRPAHRSSRERHPPPSGSRSETQARHPPWSRPPTCGSALGEIEAADRRITGRS